MSRLRIAPVLILTLAACTAPSEVPTAERTDGESATGWREIDSPVGRFSFAPRLTTADGVLVLSWLEQTRAADDGTHHQFMVSQLSDGRWSPPSWVASGADFFANWADTPGVAAAADGALIGHWLAKTAEDTYAYSILLARSEDRGVSWQPQGPLHDDATPTEHGFVSHVPEEEGVRAFWLDGRQMATGGDMTLRTARIAPLPESGEVLDERVCECCSTAAAMTDEGPVVVYRDRSEQEIRDISIVRRQGAGWTSSSRVAADDWQIEGCPVNGPAVAAAGRQVAVAWYSAGGSGPKVQIAFSEDAGATFALPRVVDGGRPMGRVDLVFDPQGRAIVSWLEGADSLAEIRARSMTAAGHDGEPVVAARTSPSRASGFPRLARIESRLYLAWVDIDGEESSRVRLVEIDTTALN